MRVTDAGNCGVMRENAGEEHEYPDGRFELRYYEGRKQVFQDAGTSALEAIEERNRLALKLAAQNAAEAAGEMLAVPGEARRSLRGALRDFLEDVEGRGKKEAHQVYEAAGNQFLDIIGKVYVDQLTPEDLTRHQRALREQGYSDRTIHNRHSNVRAFLIFCGLDMKKFYKRRPTYEKTLPLIYSPEELDALFAEKMPDKHRIAFKLMLKCGLREKEAMYLDWSSVDIKRGILRVQQNPRHGFTVKDKEARDIPIEDGLLGEMKALRKKHPKDSLIVGNGPDNPNGHLLRNLEQVVRRAKLPGRWFLHRFRATAITNWLRAGIDLRTVMSLSGHSDLQSVLRYLSPADSESVRQKINAI